MPVVAWSEDRDCRLDLLIPEDPEDKDRTELFIDGKLRVSKQGLWTVEIGSLLRIFA